MPMNSKASRKIAEAAEKRLLGHPSQAMNLVKPVMADVKNYFEVLQTCMDLLHLDREVPPPIREVYSNLTKAMEEVFPDTPHKERLMRLGLVYEVTLQLESGQPIHEYTASLTLTKRFYDKLTAILIKKELNNPQ